MFKKNKKNKNDVQTENQVLQFRDILNSYSDEQLKQKHFYFEEEIVLDCIVEIDYGFLFITHLDNISDDDD